MQSFFDDFFPRSRLSSHSPYTFWSKYIFQCFFTPLMSLKCGTAPFVGTYVTHNNHGPYSCPAVCKSFIYIVLVLLFPYFTTIVFDDIQSRAFHALRIAKDLPLKWFTNNCSREQLLLQIIHFQNHATVSTTLPLLRVWTLFSLHKYFPYLAFPIFFWLTLCLSLGIRFLKPCSNFLDTISIVIYHSIFMGMKPSSATSIWTINGPNLASTYP